MREEMRRRSDGQTSHADTGAETCPFPLVAQCNAASSVAESAPNGVMQRAESIHQCRSTATDFW